MNTSPMSEESFPCVTREAVRSGAIIAETYRVLGLLGSGGMGEVYEAEHLRLGVRVALKVPRTPVDEHSARRLLREARLTAGLSGDHVVRVFDCNVLEDGSPYVVLERLLGEDLRRLLGRQAQLPVQRALRIAIEVCAGLAELQVAGIVHRDLKPANVFVLKAGTQSYRCKLLDLGIARSLSGDTSRSTAAAGSVRYMAPEQLEDGTTISTRTDVHAAGVILYECLTGTTPHRGETVEEVMFSILNRRARPVSELRPEVSAALSSLVMRSLARDISARPESSAAFAASLSAFLVPTTNERELTAAVDETLPELDAALSHGVSAIRVRRIASSALTVGALASCAFGFTAASQSRHSPPRSAPATATTAVPSATSEALRTTLASASPSTGNAATPVQSASSNACFRQVAQEHRIELNRASSRTPSTPRPPGVSETDLALESNPYAR